MEESTTPRVFQEPCHLYQHFLDQPSVSTIETLSSSTESSSKQTFRRSMLVTGFGMRNWDSLQRALLDDEQRRQMLLSRHDTAEAYECSSLYSSPPSTLSFKTKSKSSVFTSESETISAKSPSLEYLMGLAIDDGEFEEMKKPVLGKLESIAGETEEEVDSKMTEAMKRARKYLRQHKIFQFFRFLIAHMLSEVPENPIQFLVDLLDKCLLYRSGFGNPPLLYEKAHLEQLFNLMDPMRTGFIEPDQYEIGMKTLGICSYDKNPLLSTNGLIPKEFFIEEAYECLTDLFVDMIRRYGGQLTPPSLVTPPPTEVDLVPSVASSGGM
ncbi:uncharacterized protein LOC103312206 [Tribolium castaneum]|uniref:EF-hand domain-containing protein n=1 Tax=Tribolium castaneum TaxID=7070 RepID=D6WE36_TRICA|nr:PREDICTED: uncharacterized protein LOC103312206 [Tribolium castaneum]EFA00374.1 hypothetical protein TcasGA2_TC003217 [Tribolium castaneum]|eukprot:XP_008190491.1 PREDICTED: uncharacterized protein LOC103312206 [Tribolium castaneum]